MADSKGLVDRTALGVRTASLEVGGEVEVDYWTAARSKTSSLATI